MAMRTFKPVTPSQRFKSVVNFSKSLTPPSERPETPRSLLKPKGKKAGRNTYGRITVRHKGGGHKQRYRVIDFLRDKKEIVGTVKSIDYDPNRTCFIALVYYTDGEKRYILAPQNLKVGDHVVASEKADILPGNNLSLSSIPVGTLLHNLELIPGKGGIVARSAGKFAQLMAKDGTYCHVKLPSGEIRLIHRRCTASIGQLSNQEHENTKWGKAGRMRWKGIRPTVRGVVMNPVDHPMGGGEGRASGGHPRSPWGQKAKGLKTRRNKRTNSKIVKRRKVGK